MSGHGAGGRGLERSIRWLVVLIGLDALVFAGAWGPTLLGYVGSERYEWTSLGVGVGSGVAGVALTVALAAALLANAVRSRR